MSYNLLFVCTGNTCRSPMAEALARHALMERGVTDVEVASAGTSAWGGSPASEAVPVVLDEVGVPLHDHASSPLTPERVEWADRILVMNTGHRAAVEELGGADKVELVTAHLDGDEADQPVVDPIGGGLDTYRRTRDQLQRSVDALLDRMTADDR